MERTRGIANAIVCAKLPEGRVVDGWRFHVVNVGEKPENLVGPDVDLTGWGEGAAKSIFLPHTTVIVRATVDLGAVPDPQMTARNQGKNPAANLPNGPLL